MICQGLLVVESESGLMQWAVLLELNGWLRRVVAVLCSFFKWFSDTEQKVSLDGIQDEVSVIGMVVYDGEGERFWCIIFWLTAFGCRNIFEVLEGRVWMGLYSFVMAR
jgi:hypothetical protein